MDFVMGKMCTPCYLDKAMNGPSCWKGAICGPFHQDEAADCAIPLPSAGIWVELGVNTLFQKITQCAWILRWSSLWTLLFIRSSKFNWHLWQKSAWICLSSQNSKWTLLATWRNKWIQQLECKSGQPGCGVGFGIGHKCSYGGPSGSGCEKVVEITPNWMYWAGRGPGCQNTEFTWFFGGDGAVIDRSQLWWWSSKWTKYCK